MEEAHQRATELLREYHDVLIRTRDLLLEKEKVTGAEFVALFNETPKTDTVSEPKSVIEW